MKRNKITFWGVRGSFPTPEQNKMDFGGHTSCVSIYTKYDELVVFDMGTGFIPLGKSLLNEKDPPKSAHVLID